MNNTINNDSNKLDFIKVNRLRQYLKDNGAAGVSPEVFDLINKVLKLKLDRALERSRENRRTIVMKRDL